MLPGQNVLRIKCASAEWTPAALAPKEDVWRLQGAFETEIEHATALRVGKTAVASWRYSRRKRPDLRCLTATVRIFSRPLMLSGFILHSVVPVCVSALGVPSTQAHA